jgi:hypothetical protein
MFQPNLLNFELKSHQAFTDPCNEETGYWRFVKNPHFQEELRSLENQYPVKDESHLFSDLVNTARSKREPYNRWARYREGYSGDLVKELIDRSGIDPSKHFVLDPMCGSGTTLVAAAQKGFCSLGLDVNPYAANLASCKLQRYTTGDISTVKKFLRSRKLKCPNKQVVVPAGMKAYRDYFEENNFEALAHIRSQVESLKDGSAKKLLRIAWLTILEECSNRKKDGNGLATVQTKVKDVVGFFILTVQSFLRDLTDYPLARTKAFAVSDSVMKADEYVQAFSRKVGRNAGAIIFSPPYANSFDYFESYKMELIFGGYCDLNGLQRLKEKAIRNYRICYGYQLASLDPLVNLLCEEITQAIPLKEKETGRRDSRTRIVPNLLKGYFEDMETAIELFSRVLKSGAKCYIVVDQSAYVGIVAPTDLMLARIAERRGFAVQSIIKCRKAITSGQQLKRYPYLKTILRESILAMTKK